MTTRRAIIELDESNLYSNGRIIDLGNNELFLTREPIDFSESEKDTYHVIREGDEITALAYEYYGSQVGKSGRLWWIIADANPEIRNVWDLSPYVGQNIKIPNWSRTKLLI